MYAPLAYYTQRIELGTGYNSKCNNTQMTDKVFEYNLRFPTEAARIIIIFIYPAYTTIIPFYCGAYFTIAFFLALPHSPLPWFLELLHYAQSICSTQSFGKLHLFS